MGGPLGIWIPDLSSYRSGSGPRLRGLRCIHTHLKGETLTQDDLTDLALLRLDLMAALEVQEKGIPGAIFMAHLLPQNEKRKNWRCWDPLPVTNLNLNCLQMIQALEDELARTQVHRQAGDRRDRAILIHASPAPRALIEDSLNELSALADAAGIVVLEKFRSAPPALSPPLLDGPERNLAIFLCGPFNRAQTY